jgi:hypothetical protein
MDETSKWFEQIKSRCTLLSEAYRLQLSRLYWANLLFVVAPAVSSTAAAIVGALNPAIGLRILSVSVPAASALAGSAAVLIAVHRALKCDEYQAECLRLSQAYQSIALAAEAALSRPPDERDIQQKRLSEKIEVLAESTKAQLSTPIMRKAEAMVGVKLYEHSAV